MLLFPGRIKETYTNTWDPEYFQCKASTELDGLRIFAIEIIYDRLINGIQFHYSKRSDNNTNYSGNGSRVLGEYSLQQIHWEGHALGEVSKMQIDDTSMTIGGVTIPIVEWRNGIRTAMKCRLGACPALNIQEGEFEFTEFYTYFQGHVERESGGEAILYRGTRQKFPESVRISKVVGTGFPSSGGEIVMAALAKDEYIRSVEVHSALDEDDHAIYGIRFGVDHKLKFSPVEGYKVARGINVEGDLSPIRSNSKSKMLTGSEMRDLKYFGVKFDKCLRRIKVGYELEWKWATRKWLICLWHLYKNGRAFFVDEKVAGRTNDDIQEDMDTLNLVCGVFTMPDSTIRKIILYYC